MPPVRRVERKGGFLVADGRNNAATVAQTELLRGADPLVVWERRCKGLDWLGKVFPEIMTQQLVGGVVRRGILYSELEYVLGGVVRIHEGFRGWEFKNTLLHPGFLTDVSTALGEDERSTQSQDGLLSPSWRGKWPILRRGFLKMGMRSSQRMSQDTFRSETENGINLRNILF